MGCGGSKPSANTVTPMEEVLVPKHKSADPETKAEINAKKSGKAEKNALPSIQKNGPMRPATAKGIAFTIPLDEKATGSNGSIKKSLPKLNVDVNSKLANAEARWQELDSKSSLKSSGSGKRQPPANLTKKTDMDTEELREKLLEREKKAEENRAKQLQQKTDALAKKDKYADTVRERAKTQTGDDGDDVEYGGEGEDDE
ncbi:hypothetical protein SmJEL517_g03878 [Synchytrium microbalum]|uniref:Uncharacterized protein n=1 Tax=Synchytrium microbalum TaxID=1806994 RepID=A0A507C5D9_9FUNG|nr:uncharacterized protein SmJEL517_g03878 [Synchytrium microbalum]TPX33196.1 hypothetical protein SmJEL517_g03878 [Synchytrium microbalum]